VGVYRIAAALAALVALPGTAVAGQLSASGEVQGALYPRTPVDRAAIGDEVRGWASIAFDHPLSANLDVGGDLVWYPSTRRHAVVDGEAKFVWRGARGALAGGLLRERWGRFTDSPVDPLGAANTPFSLVRPELRLSQPAIRATAFFERVSVDVYAVAGARRQPVPDDDGRFGFGVVTHDVVRRGGLGDQALGVRISGTELDLDWAAHVFGGLSPRPTFVPRFTADARLAAVDAVYTDILQVSGEVETTRADWRFLAEGFSRRGAIDVTGQETTYAHIALVPSMAPTISFLASNSWPTRDRTAPTSRLRPPGGRPCESPRPASSRCRWTWPTRTTGCSVGMGSSPPSRRRSQSRRR
jgi:hypothetical protein